MLGYSTDSTIYAAVTPLPGPSLPQTLQIGSYVGTDGLLHVLTRIPVRLAQFQAGKWGDPRGSSVSGPTLVQKKPVQLKKRPDGTVLVLTKLTIPSQAHLYASVFAKGSTRLAILKHGSRLGPWLEGKASKTAQTLILKAGAIPVRMRLNGKALKSGQQYRLRVIALDPWGRRATLIVPFRRPSGLRGDACARRPRPERHGPNGHVPGSDPGTCPDEPCRWELARLREAEVDLRGGRIRPA